MSGTRGRGSSSQGRIQEEQVRRQKSQFASGEDPRRLTAAATIPNSVTSIGEHAFDIQWQIDVMASCRFEGLERE